MRKPRELRYGTVEYREVWISPDGEFFDGDAHENRAKEILEHIYHEQDTSNWAGDRLEELGWVRATASLMWDVRVRQNYWEDKELPQKQLDALFDWCQLHGKPFPYSYNGNA